MAMSNHPDLPLAIRGRLTFDLLDHEIIVVDAGYFCVCCGLSSQSPSTIDERGRQLYHHFYTIFDRTDDSCPYDDRVFLRNVFGSYIGNIANMSTARDIADDLNSRIEPEVSSEQIVL